MKSGIARDRRVTGFNDAVSYPELRVGLHCAIEAGAIWVDGEPVVTDGRLVNSPHPDYCVDFGREMVRVLADSIADQAGSGERVEC